MLSWSPCTEAGCCLRIHVRDDLDDQRTAFVACVLELLLIRPPGRAGAITMHPASHHFGSIFRAVHLYGSPGFGLGKANCGYKFEAGAVPASSAYSGSLGSLNR